MDEAKPISPELLNLIKSGASSGIPSTIKALRKARIWCRSVDDAVGELLADPLIAHEQRRLLVARITEEPLSPENRESLLGLVGQLEETGRQPGRVEGRPFSALRDVLELLDRGDRVPRCITYLSSRHWQQRAMACRILRAEDLSEEEAGDICKAIAAHPNRLVVELAARNAGNLSSTDCIDIVLPRLENDYWQSRVIEKLLERPDGERASLIRRWPMAALWAIARNRRTDLLPDIVSHLPILERDWRRLPLVAWALGRLAATEELEALDRRMRSTPEWKAYADIHGG